jgi:hypothetical protein
MVHVDAAVTSADACWTSLIMAPLVYAAQRLVPSLLGRLLGQGFCLVCSAEES